MQRGAWQRLLTAYETWRITRREKRHAVATKIMPVANIEPLSEDDVPLVFITHNDATMLPFFLRHYRKLGVSRFICVDDVSTDGTRDYLASQQDVDVWTSPQRFSEARRGRRWREELFSRYGLDRWYVNVDSDEFLIYDGWETRSIRELAQSLQTQGIRRLPSPMIDMYPGDGSREPDPAEDDPWLFSNHFDGKGYFLSLEKRGISVKGGPRHRIYGEENQLIKYPLIFWDATCFFGSSLHRPLPYDRNFASVWGLLLHFKFFTNYRAKITEAATGRQHYNDSQHYKKMMSVLEQDGLLDLNGAVSAAFEDAEEMRRLGFMTAIDYPPR